MKNNRFSNMPIQKLGIKISLPKFQPLSKGLSPQGREASTICVNRSGAFSSCAISCPSGWVAQKSCATGFAKCRCKLARFEIDF